MKKTETFSETFWAFNYPVQLWKDEETGKVSFVGYMPRKESCFHSDDFIPEEELNDFIDNSIEKLEKGIELFKKFKAGEIDLVYYWDTD